MSTNFPNSLDNTTDLINNATDATPSATTHAGAHNNIADSIIAIETVLGVNPNAGSATVSARIASLETGSVKLVPTTSQKIAPTVDVVALTVKVGNNLNISNLFEAHANDDTILAFIDHLGNFSAQSIKINGTALAIQHLSDGKQIQKKDQFRSFTRVQGVTPGLSGNPQTALQVTANGTWALAIAAGSAIIQGTDNTAQDQYVATQGTTYTLNLGTHAPASNPRIDAICIQYNDSLWTARTPADTFQFVQVAGTPTAGANLTNLSGKPTIPASALLLAYILVNPTDTGVSVGNVQDERTLEGPAVWGEDGHRYRLGVDASGQLGMTQVT